MLADLLALDFLASLVSQLQNFKASEMDIKKLYILIRTESNIVSTMNEQIFGHHTITTILLPWFHVL